MDNLDRLGQPLAGPITADAIEAALRADLREVTVKAGSGRPVARPSVLTLIAAALDAPGVERILDAIEHLARQHPSRVIILLPDFPVGASDLQVWHQPMCFGSSGEGYLMCGDQIVIAGRGSAAHRLPSLADQLELPGLPVFLWWSADFSPGYDEVFDRLTDVADRLIVDSNHFGSLATAYGRLARVARRHHNPCIPSDLNWARLTPWRDVLAQLFDSSAVRPIAGAIDALRLSYDPADGEGPAQAILLIAWLATRLGWENSVAGRLDLPGAPGQSIPARLQRAGGTVAIEVHASSTGGRGLSDVELIARGATFRVARSADCIHAAAEVEVDGAPPVRHCVGFEPLSRSELLGIELMIYGRDTVYEAALDDAARLLTPAEPAPVSAASAAADTANDTQQLSPARTGVPRP